MEVGIGKGGAVGGDQQVRVLKEGGVRRNQPQLHRPLGKLALRNGCRDVGGRLRVQRPCHRAGAAVRFLPGGSFRRLTCQNGLLVIGGSLPLDDADGAGGAGRQAVAQAVAVVVADQLCLSIHHRNRALVAGAGAQAAAVAAFFIDRNNFADHRLIPSLSSIA